VNSSSKVYAVDLCFFFFFKSAFLYLTPLIIQVNGSLNNEYSSCGAYLSDSGVSSASRHNSLRRGEFS
jgi:hypothetical protein